MMDDVQRQVARWLARGETGESSKTMALWLAFGELYRGAMAPADPADFDRCLRLLNAAPALRALLPAMADVNNEWRALVARWGEIERTHIAEVGVGWTKARNAPHTYKLMREVIDAARNGDAP